LTIGAKYASSGALMEGIMERNYRDRNHFNEIMLNGTEEEILKILVSHNPWTQGYPIIQDVLQYRNTKTLVKTTWWLVIATWALVIYTIITSFIYR
jgi:hypothetical protein